MPGKVKDLSRIVTSVGFHPHGTVIATASTDRTIKLFDIRMHKLIQHYGDAHAATPLPGQHLEGKANSTGAVNSVSFGGLNGEWLISTGMDGLVKVWDVQEGHLFYTLHGHKNGPTTAAVFSPEGDFFASGGADTQVMVWKSNFDKIDKTGLEFIGGNAENHIKKSPIEKIKSELSSPLPRKPPTPAVFSESPKIKPVSLGAPILSPVVRKYLS
jgi:centriolar protein POC1